MKSIETKPFEIFNNTWALVSAGPISNHNSMTISWGGMGTLWSKSVTTVYIKPCRYTYKFMEENEYFSLSFFDDEYKKALGVMGSKSGRDVDKDALSGLTPIGHDKVTIYKEAKLTLICKKIYFNDLDINHIPEEAVDRYYKIEKPHRMYVGEVIEIIEK